jgi:hypothetical protein
MTERPLPEEHEGLMKTALKLQPTEALPTGLVELYWDAERTARRIGCRLDMTSLVMICLLANRATPASPVSFLDGPKAVHGDRVLVRFRGEWRWGVYKTQHGKALIVQVDDDPAIEDREFHPTSVRWPTKEELALIGEA